jgi:hypothetical protein
MLTFPPTWIPNVPLEAGRVQQALASYNWTAALGPFPAVEEGDLVLVGRYLVHHGGDPYWDVIMRGGVRGYSLYLHELTELRWYAEHSHNPFDAATQIQHYPLAHSLALLEEHRYLQRVARERGQDFSLRELILANPHGDPPAGDWVGDWDVVWQSRQQELDPKDAEMDSARVSQAEAFYRDLGFLKVT